MLRASLLLISLLGTSLVIAADYPIVVCVQKRPNDTTLLKTHEANRPFAVTGDTDLMILRPDGSLAMLVDAGPKEAIIDPCVSFDGKSVYFAKFNDVTKLAQDQTTPVGGADIWRVDVATGQQTRLTNGEMTPNKINEGRASGRSFNTGPCELPGGLIAFTSTRNDYVRPRSPTLHAPQLFVMDTQGRNVEQTGFLNLMGALHPVVLTDGRIMWSTHEGQGLRDMGENGNRLWGLWASKPDGRTWEPLISAFVDAAVYHFHTQLSNGSLVCEEYYTSNNFGYGNLWRFNPAAQINGKPPFGSPNYTEDRTSGSSFPFSPIQMTALTPWTHGRDDFPAPIDKVSGKRVGKLTHPSGAPGNDLLAVWSNFGPATNNSPPQNPKPQGTVVIIPKGEPCSGPAAMIVVKADPAFNFYQPKALVPYRAIYGIDQPHEIPFCPNDGEEADRGLPAGSPFGLIGTSTFYKRDDGPGLNQFGKKTGNWNNQGSIAGTADNAEIFAVRVLSMEPRSWQEGNGGYDPQGKPLPTFTSHAQERLRIMGEVPLRKFNADGTPLLDIDGNPDTSFLAKIPADVPFTFQLLNADGQALNTAQTWHQVRPGEGRYDCGGCHAHSQVGTHFEVTAAAKAGYLIPDLTGKPVDVEYTRDVRPIILANCTSCHSAASPAGGLDLATSPFTALANDPDAKFGIKPASGHWQYTDASRVTRKFQSRRSPLAWKLLRKRTDGNTNATSTSDVDYLDGGCQAHTIAPADRAKIMRWIDLGCPAGNGPAGKNPWFADATKPTIALSSPRRIHPTPLTEIKVGLFDHYSGLDLSTLSITADFPVGGKPAGAELRALFTVQNSIYSVPVASAPTRGTVTVQVRDQAGNLQRIVRSFQTGTTPGPISGSDLESLRRQLAAVEAQIAAAEGNLAALRLLKADLEARIAAQ